MNFWKILSKLLDEMFLNWKDKFISYKYLKKQLNLIYPVVDNLYEDERPNKRPRFTDYQVDHKNKEEKKNDFLKLLAVEINKINRFFEDQEEECVIKLRLLTAAAFGAKDSKEELMRVERKMVDFHGDMVLLNNYSSLNYIGLLKILKKYDKRSGEPIRLHFIEMVLQEPFLKTEVINSLVDECESMIRRIFSWKNQLASPGTTYQQGSSNKDDKKEVPGVPREIPEDEKIENAYTKLCKSALKTMREIRNTSTVNMFSLPPMACSKYGDLDESLR